MANLKDVIYISNEDYDTLVTTGTVTIEGTTLTYDENCVYVTPDKLASTTEDGLMSASDKSKLDGLDNANLVHKTGDETVDGVKTFTSYPIAKGMNFYSDASSPSGNFLGIINDNGYNAKIKFSDYGFIFTGNSVGALKDNATDLGAASYRWKDLYLNGSINFGDGATISKDSSNRINLNYNSDAKVKIGSAETTFKNRVGADADNTYDIGRDTVRWKDAYIAGNLSDGTNSIAVANIASLDTAQTFTGTKTFTAPLNITFGNSTYKLDDGNFGQLYIGNNNAGIILDGGTLRTGHLAPQSNNSKDIGTSGLKYKDLYLAGNLSDGTNSTTIADIVGIKEDLSSQISLDNESSLTILRKECAIIKKGDSIKLHIYISGKNESGASVSGVRFAGSGSTLTISNTTLANAIKDMNGNALSTSITGQIKAAIQVWYNDGNTTVQTLRMSHQGTNQIYLYSAGYSASISDNGNFILSMDEDLAF